MKFKSALVAGAVVLASAGPLATPASAADGVLYSQAGAVGDNAWASDTVLSNAAFNAEGADDFTVPAGETWSISRVDVVAVDKLVGGHPLFTVAVYEDDGGAPGAQVATRTGHGSLEGLADGCCPGSTFEQSIDLDGAVVLGEGTYWLGLQAYASPDTTQQWFWHEIAVNGSEAQWRNPNDGYGTGCTAFAAVSACLTPGPVDFAFTLVGDVVGVVQFSAPTFDVNERYAPNGRATITVTRTGDLSEAATVSYNLSDGTAQAAKDYVDTRGLLKFLPGETEKTFQVRILRDTSTEGTETVVLTLGAPSVGTVIGATNPATLNINDDL